MQLSVTGWEGDYEGRVGWRTFPLTKNNMGHLFGGRLRGELFSLLRTGASALTLQTIFDWASEKDMTHVMDAVKDVKTNNNRSFTIFFDFGGETGNQASIISYLIPDGHKRYHADYILLNGETGAILNMFVGTYGDWESDSDIGNPLLHTPIGKEIARKEVLQVVIKETEELEITTNQPDPEPI
jgi:hypothetical protein